MTLSHRMRPSAGLGIFLSAVLISSLFFAWGWSRPPLDRVWQIQLELLLGTRPALSGDERELLQETLVRYPLLAANMLEGAESGLVSAHVGGMADRGYAYIVRATAAAPGLLSISSPNGSALDLKVRTASGEMVGRASAAAPFIWELPADGPFPQLVEVRLQGVDPQVGTAHIVAVAGAATKDRIAPMLVEVLPRPTEQKND